MGLMQEYKQVSTLLREKHSIVFYAESRHYYVYFEKLLNDLLRSSAVNILYITSDPGDPLLGNSPTNMKVVYVKWMLGYLFNRLKAKVMVLTMPDLDNFLFKRSKDTGTYVYIFHALVSIHQQYRKKAFFHYDAVFCTGSYQRRELEMAELLYHQKNKDKVNYGYPLLGQLAAIKNTSSTKSILVAPSWFDGCIFDTCLTELLVELEKLDYNIVLRSHPEYEKRSRKKFSKLSKLVKDSSRLSFDQNKNVIESLSKTDILVTDRSGIAFEFAFGRKRPVLFIDTVLKQVNPDWKELNIEPIENSLRSELGIAISPKELNKIPLAIKELEVLAISFESKMEELGNKIFYNSEDSYQEGCRYILSKL
jgi:YidC/Oxa1 family membrane protein insertase